MIPFPTDVRDPKFVEKLNWWDAQNKQDAANKKIHDEYLQYSANYLAQETHDAELGLTVDPPKPLPVMTIYNDDMTISHQPFPDLKLPMIDPRAGKPTTGPGFGSLNPTGATVDAQATLLMLQHVVQELQAARADIAAIKSKLGL